MLISLSILETIGFQFTEVLLVSSMKIVGAFALSQAYCHPFKSTLINILELTFMSIFLLQSAVTLYFYPSIYGYNEVNTAVIVFGALAFVLFCLVILFHVHNVCSHTTWHATVRQAFEGHFRKYLPKKSYESLIVQAQDLSLNSVEENYSSYEHYQESFLEHM